MKTELKKGLTVALVLAFGITAVSPWDAYCVTDYTEDPVYTEDPAYTEEPAYTDETVYTDEYGNTIETEPAEMRVTKDTSWFDYLNPEKTYHIRNEAQLMGFASLVNEQQVEAWKPNRHETFEGVTIVLDADVKLTEDWIPAGNDDTVCFKGTFDGKGHTISGLHIDTSGDYAGFFGYLSGTVKNLTLKGKVSTTGGRCGAIAGYLAEGGEIADCKSYVNVSAGAETGGICGYNEGSVTDTLNYGNVKGTLKVGGICGENWSSITRCGNRGNIRSTARGFATYGTGGVAGRSLSENAVISKCYNTGEIRSRTEGTGGITGFANVYGSRILSCYNTGKINVRNAMSMNADTPGYAGGIVGIIPSRSVRIISCYNAGTINNSDFSGGIIGLYNNNSNRREDVYIRNNHFLSQGIRYGVGADGSGASVNLSGTGSITAGALVNGSSALGPAYIDDNRGEYGNYGYPVLTWQEALDESERTYLSHIPSDLQKKLDTYLSSGENSRKPGYGVYIFFNHNEFSSDVMRKYNER